MVRQHSPVCLENGIAMKAVNGMNPRLLRAIARAMALPQPAVGSDSFALIKQQEPRWLYTPRSEVPVRR